MQAISLSMFAVGLTVLTQWSFTFTGENAAATIVDEMPDKYQWCFYGLSIMLIVNAALAFTASYFEIAWTQKLAAFSCVLSFIAAVALAVINEITSASILSRM